MCPRPGQWQSPDPVNHHPCPQPRITGACRAMKKQNVMLTLLAVGLVVILIIVLCLCLLLTSKPHSHVYPRAAVATDAKYCSEIGR